MSQPIQIGAARVDITPGYEVGLMGYALREGPSTGVLDRVHARAAVFDDGGARIVIVNLDLMEVTRDLADTLRQVAADQAQAPVENVCVSCTHTHAAPGAWPLKENLPVLPRYIADLHENVRRAVADATAGLAPAHLSTATAPLEIGYNRRGYTDESTWDHTLRGLVVTGDYGRPVCLLLEYACHAVCMGHDNNRISGDWPGRMCSRLEAQINGNAVVLFMQGCGGDIDPRKELRLSIERMDQAVDRAATAAERILASASPGAAAGALAAQTAVVDLPYEPIDVEAWQQALSAMEPRLAQTDPDDKSDWDLSQMRARRDSMTHLLALQEQDKSPTHMPLAIQHITLGPVEMVALSGEVLFGIGQAIRARAGRGDLWVPAYCNGGHGYVPTDQALAEGGYEPDESNYYYCRPKLQPGSAGMLIDAAVELINR